MIYFDNAATTFPKPEIVYKEVDRCLREYCANPGRSGHKMSLEAGRIVLETRAALSRLFNIKSIERIVFTSNATDAINIGLKGFLKKGDHVITSSMEHNSVIRPLKAMEKNGVSVTIIPCDEAGRLNTSDVEKAIQENTRLIVCTHGSNVTGTIMPIEEIGAIAKKHGIRFMVDSAQTAGVFEIDVRKMNIDLLTFTGHKGLFGIQGVGGLYIGEDIEVETQREGGTGSLSESILQPDILPDKYESGTLNTPGIAGLFAGLSFIEEMGIDNIRKKEDALTAYFLNSVRQIKGIKVYGPEITEQRASVVSLNIGNVGSSEVTFILDDTFGIATRSGLHCSPLAHKTIGTLEQGTIRFSFGYFNTQVEVGQAINALERIAQIL